MPINLKIHIGNLVVGFVISIYWFCTEKRKTGLPLGAFCLLASWMALHAYIFSAQNVHLSFWEAFVRTLDVNQYKFGPTQMRAVIGTTSANYATFFMLAMICTNTIFFRWLWLIKNKNETANDWLRKIL